MPSFLKVRGYVFDTEALKDAYLAFSPASRSTTTGYDEDALRVLLRYFADWGPARADSLTAPTEDSLDTLSTDEKQDLYNDFTKQIAENLAEQYGREVDQRLLEEFLHRITDEALPEPLGTFCLRYLWRTSKRIHEYEQTLFADADRDGVVDSTSEVSDDFAAAIHRLPAEYLDQKQAQYADDNKVNRIRFKALETIRSEGSLSEETLDAYQREENAKYDTDIMQMYDEFTVLGQLYYDYFKPRLNAYLDDITTHLVETLGIEESSVHRVNFAQPRNRLDDHTWFAIYPTKEGDKANAYQLYTGIWWDRVRYGLYAGDEIRGEGWREEIDIDTITEIDALTIERLTEKFDTVLQEYYRLNGMQSVDPPEKPPDEIADTVARQLTAQKQVVFYGPPGTGKTYDAQRFANWWVHEQTSGQPQDEQVQSVTFHPSFSYEDYIEGLTAALYDGSVTYEIEDGIFKRVAESARTAYQQAKDNDETPPPYVLIIDEINRGNLAQIFGETITQLEADKRLDAANETVVRLAHSDEPFVIPPNLYLIGTMNTADRSIALVDTALRRRFRFIARPPAFDDIIEEYGLPAAQPDGDDEFESLLWLSVVTLRDLNNRIIKSADLGKGKQIGHSRLFGLETVVELRDTWRYDILPLLEEYYFGQFDRIRQELFDGAGEELFDWEQQRIREFTVQDLGDALSAFADGELDITYSASTVEAPSSSTETRIQWDKELFFEEVEAEFDQQVIEVYRDFHEFGSKEADNVGYGTGKRTGAMQFYWDEYQDGRYLVYEIRTDGTLQFRFWGRRDYGAEIFEPFLEKINPLADDSVDIDLLMSDDFSRLQISMTRLQDEETREQVKQAIREFIDDCAAVAP